MNVRLHMAYSVRENVVFVAGRVQGTQLWLPWCITIFTEMLDHKSNKLWRHHHFFSSLFSELNTTIPFIEGTKQILKRLLFV